MSTSLLLPIRVPELGPALGKIVVGTMRTPGGLDLSGVRLRLATDVFEQVGKARRLATEEERAAAIDVIGRDAWLGAWESAVEQVTDLLVEQANSRMLQQAEIARMPKRRRRKLTVSPRERATLRARLGSTGATLVDALDRLAATGAVAVVGKSGDGMRGWQEAVRTAARRLEASWLTLEDAVVLESRRWDDAAREIASWRRPMWPVFAAGTVGMAVAVWAGLVFGGYIESPAWFTTLWTVVVRP